MREARVDRRNAAKREFISWMKWGMRAGILYFDIKYKQFAAKDRKEMDLPDIAKSVLVCEPPLLDDVPSFKKLLSWAESEKRGRSEALRLIADDFRTLRRSIEKDVERCTAELLRIHADASLALNETSTLETILVDLQLDDAWKREALADPMSASGLRQSGVISTPRNAQSASDQVKHLIDRYGRAVVAAAVLDAADEAAASTTSQKASSQESQQQFVRLLQDFVFSKSHAGTVWGDLEPKICDKAGFRGVTPAERKSLFTSYMKNFKKSLATASAAAAVKESPDSDGEIVE